MDLTQSTILPLYIEKGMTLDKSVPCYYYSGDTLTPFSFTAYTASTLTVKLKPNDFNNIILFDTDDDSITFDDDAFTLTKTDIETNVRSGQYVYDMTLSSSDGKRGFLRGDFYVIDQSTGDLESDQTYAIVKE